MSLFIKNNIYLFVCECDDEDIHFDSIFNFNGIIYDYGVSSVIEIEINYCRRCRAMIHLAMI